MAAKLKPGEGTKVRLPAADSASLVGVEMAQATVGNISEGIECYAELAFNQNRLAQIAAPVGGILQSVDVDLGAKVDEKQAAGEDLVGRDRGSGCQSGAEPPDART